MFDNAKEPVDILGAVDPVVPANLPTAPGAIPVSQAAVSRRPPIVIFAIVGIVILLGSGVGAFYYFTKIKGPAATVAPTAAKTDKTAATDTTAKGTPAPAPTAVPAPFPAPGNAPAPAPVPTPTGTDTTTPPPAVPVPTPAPVAPPVSPSPNIPTPTMPAVVPPPAVGAPDLTKDTDGDGLSDFEEVNIYHTDPLKADTDGDGYSDGAEVKGGYNPLGAGKYTAQDLANIAALKAKYGIK